MQLTFFYKPVIFFISYCASRDFLPHLHSLVNLSLTLAALSREWHTTESINILLTVTLSQPVVTREHVARPSSCNDLPLTVSCPCCKPSTVTKRTFWMLSLSTTWKCCHVMGRDCPSRRLRPAKSRVLFHQSICNSQRSQHPTFLKDFAVR